MPLYTSAMQHFKSLLFKSPNMLLYFTFRSQSMAGTIQVEF